MWKTNGRIIKAQAKQKLILPIDNLEEHSSLLNSETSSSIHNFVSLSPLIIKFLYHLDSILADAMNSPEEKRIEIWNYSIYNSIKYSTVK